MNLKKKKELARKTLKAGRKKIVFIKLRLEEIKDAITKQDIKDLYKDGAIVIKQNKGRKTVVKRKRRRGVGKVKKVINKRKKEYVIMTRKLRKYIAALYSQGKISKEEVKDIRKKIRNRIYRSHAHLKELLKGRNR